MKVEYVNHMGDDSSVCDSARVSFAKQANNFTQEQNTKLINYLAKHNHWSPFTHTAITLRVQAPIAIRTQCMKHTVGLNINEESRRYISDMPELFIPEFRNKPDSNIKQGSSEVIDTLTVHIPQSDDTEEFSMSYSQDNLQKEYSDLANQTINFYNWLIASGVAPEQARFILPQGVETNWIWTGNLYSFARFYNQRSDSYAQKEIQDLAQMVSDIIAPFYPISWKALTEVDYELNT